MKTGDEKFMKMAIKLAEGHLGATYPNPAVGAVIAGKNKVISFASHTKSGASHAEVKAIKKAGDMARGAKLYVNLEPCAHFGKTPPCCEAIIKSGIKKVIIAVKDPNPLNNGKGIRKLKKAGIKVTTGILKKEAVYLNRAFFKFITGKIPYVSVKIAQSLDGKIATKTGRSKWITSKKSRHYVQKLRQRTDAILVGIKTVIKDNPGLNCRLNPKKILTKIVIDPHLKTPAGANIFKEAKKVLLVTKKGLSPKIKNAYRKKAEIIEVAYDKQGRLNLRQALKKIAEYNIVHLMIEGGGHTIASFLKENLVDEIFIFVAPKIIGGRLAPTSVEGEGINKIKDAICFKNLETEKTGEDLLLKCLPV